MINRPMANITPTASDTSSNRPSLPNTSCTRPGRWTSLTATTPSWMATNVSVRHSVRVNQCSATPAATPTTAPRTMTCRAPGGMLRLATHEYTPTPVVPSTAPHRAKTMNRGRFEAPRNSPAVSSSTATTVTTNSTRSSSSAGSLLLSQRGRSDVRGVGIVASQSTAWSSHQRPSRRARRSRRNAPISANSTGSAAPRTKPRKPGLTVDVPPRLHRRGD